MNIEGYIKKCQRLVNASIKKNLPPLKKEPRHLHQAMHYATLNGGKRLRAAFIYATGEALRVERDILNNIAASIEMIHAFTLIHDDLPALDNDNLRRGKPTCHIVFGESTAILTGDALQTLAFEILAKIDKKKLLPRNQLRMIQTLAVAVGSRGVIGGEELDLSMVNSAPPLKQIENMYKLKTGALFTACIQLSALAANCKSKKTLSHLTKFGEYIGLAFQIHDDIVGIESDTTLLGKQQGADLFLNKPVYPVVAGMSEAKSKEKFLYQKALTHLDLSGIETTKLKALAAYVIERNY